MRAFAFGLATAALLAGSAFAQTTPGTQGGSGGNGGTAMTAPGAPGGQSAGQGSAMPNGTMSRVPPATGTVGAAGSGTGSSTGPATPPGNAGNNAGSDSGQAAASGNDNQAVATTGANAAQPAHGANSFTQGQARSRIASNGFSKVSNLHKDNNGVWRGQAQKNGQKVGVWLDYKGNVGQD